MSCVLAISFLLLLPVKLIQEVMTRWRRLSVRHSVTSALPQVCTRKQVPDTWVEAVVLDTTHTSILPPQSAKQENAVTPMLPLTWVLPFP